MLKKHSAILPRKKCYVRRDLADYYFSKLEEYAFAGQTSTFFFFVGRRQYLFHESNFFVITYHWVTSCYDWKFTCFGKANDWVVPTILHVKLLLRRIFELFSIFCGLKFWRRPQNLCWEMRMIWSDATRSGGFGQVWLSTIFDSTRNIVSLRTRRTIPYFPSAVLKLVVVFLRKNLYILWANDILFPKKLFVSNDFQVLGCRRYKNAIPAAGMAFLYLRQQNCSLNVAKVEKHHKSNGFFSICKVTPR